MQIAGVELEDLEFESIGSWPKGLRILLILAAGLLAIAIGYLLDLQDMYDKYEKISAERYALQESFEQSYDQASNLEEYKKQVIAVEKSLEAIAKQLPQSSEEAELLDDVSHQAISSNLTFQSFKPLPEKQESFYVEHPIELSLQGGFHNFGNFVSHLVTMPRIVTLHDFTIKTVPENPKRLDIAATVQTYWATEQQIKSIEKAIANIQKTENTVIPEKTVVPEATVVPEKPVTPDNTVVPAKTVAPEKPVVPSTPVVPEKPVTPQNMVAPVKTAVPEKPVVQSTPSIPEKPVTPQNTVAPVKSVVPEKPVVPVSPNNSTKENPVIQKTAPNPQNNNPTPPQIVAPVSRMKQRRLLEPTSPPSPKTIVITEVAQDPAQTAVIPVNHENETNVGKPEPPVNPQDHIIPEGTLNPDSTVSPQDTADPEKMNPEKSGENLVSPTETIVRSQKENALPENANEREGLRNPLSSERGEQAILKSNDLCREESLDSQSRALQINISETAVKATDAVDQEIVPTEQHNLPVLDTLSLVPKEEPQKKIIILDAEKYLFNKNNDSNTMPIVNMNSKKLVDPKSAVKSLGSLGLDATLRKRQDPVQRTNPKNLERNL